MVEELIQKEEKFEHMPVRIHQNQCMLIDPRVDCSEKQLYVRNGLKNPFSNLQSWLVNGDKITHKLDQKIRVPEKLGMFTKDNFGLQFAIGHESKDPRFHNFDKEYMAPDNNPDLIK